MEKHEISNFNTVKCSNAEFSRQSGNNKSKNKEKHIVNHPPNSNRQQITLSRSVQAQFVECGNAPTQKLKEQSKKPVTDFWFPQKGLPPMNTFDIECKKQIDQFAKQEEEKKKNLVKIDILKKDEMTLSTERINKRQETGPNKTREKPDPSVLAAKAQGALTTAQEKYEWNFVRALRQRNVKINICSNRGRLYGELDRNNIEHFRGILTECDPLIIIHEESSWKGRIFVREAPHRGRVSVNFNRSSEDLDPSLTYTILVLNYHEPPKQIRRMLYQSSSGQNKEEHACSYCKVTDCSVVQCFDKSCKKWFCNNKLGLDNSHIVNHLLYSDHHQVSLPLSSQLQCAKCERDDVFELLVAHSSNTRFRLYCDSCIATEKYQQSVPLVVNLRLSVHVVRRSEENALRDIKAIKQGEVDRLELEWKKKTLHL